MSSLKNTILEAVKTAMRARETERLGTLRMLTAAIKQVEIDASVSLDNDDAGVVVILRRMIKQRRDSIAQYEQGNRPELAAAEAREIDILSVFLPQALSEVEMVAIIDQAIAQTGASSAKDMGKVMPLVRAAIDGRADMGTVSALIKGKLA